MGGSVGKNRSQNSPVGQWLRIALVIHAQSHGWIGLGSTTWGGVWVLAEGRGRRVFGPSVDYPVNQPSWRFHGSLLAGAIK